MKGEISTGGEGDSENCWEWGGRSGSKMFFEIWTGIAGKKRLN